MTASAASDNDGEVTARRRIVIGAAAAITAGLTLAAVLFGMRGVEAASWLAGVAGLVVAIAAFVLAPHPNPGGGESQVPGAGSVTVSGDLGGIASTGDGATNIQRQ